MLNRNIILLAGMAFMLSACAWTEGQKAGGRDHVYLESQHPDDLDGKARDADGTPSTSTELSYDKIASQYSNDSVELFSLEGEPQPVRVASAGERRSGGRSDFGLQGIPSNTDPSVTVFPFSDDMYTPGVSPEALGYSSAQLTPMPGDPIPGDIDNLATFTGNPNIIYFQHGSSALSATARQVIASVAQKDGLISVEGHASQRAQVSDPVERGILNLQMSMKRAMNVTKELIKQGVPPTSIKTTAFGEARPAVPEVDSEAEAKNRRVEIRTAR